MPASPDSHTDQRTYLWLRIQADAFASESTTSGGAGATGYLDANVRQSHASMKKAVAVSTIKAPEE
jgi:hypothetical protein